MIILTKIRCKMKRKILLIIILLIPFNVLATELTGMHFTNAIVYDMTDNVVRYELNADEETSIASLTKIMTTIVSIEKIKDFNDEVTYTSKMDSLVDEEASIAGLKIGEKYTYDDLIYASILPSGADATTALAISLYGSVDNFVKEMNNYANKLDMKHTHFINVTGMEVEGHYSTCEDLLKLLKYAFNNEKFKEAYTSKSHTLSNGQTVYSTVIAYSGGNDVSRILGSKTGFTYNAGRCISLYFTSNGHEYLAITLGAPSNSSTIHVVDALNLIDFLDDNYSLVKIVEKNSFNKQIKVKDSNIAMYKVSNDNEVVKYLENDYDKNKVVIKYEGEDELSFLDKENDKIGKINYYYDGKLLASEDVILDVAIKPSIPKLLVSYWYIVLIFILLTFLMYKIIRRKLRRKRRKKAYV